MTSPLKSSQTSGPKTSGAEPSLETGLIEALDRFPRVDVAHTPTPLDPAHVLGDRLGISLHIKRDDCTGFGFGGNKVRQLEYYFGAALRDKADTVLITGAVQSNYARTTAAMAGRFSMECHLQLEERVADAPETYRTSGNVLLDHILGAHLHSYPQGEDEAGADRALGEIAKGLKQQGKRPYIIPLGPDNPPLGALGYVRCAIELCRQIDEQGLKVDQIILPSGSSFTHAGMLFGLRAIGCRIPVLGICVRRDASQQNPRVAARTRQVGELLGLPTIIRDEDVAVYDGVFAPGYGKLNPITMDAIKLAARTEGVFLDPVYTGKAMAGLMAAKSDGLLAGDNVIFVHTGGQPGIFAYGDTLLKELT